MQCTSSSFTCSSGSSLFVCLFCFVLFCFVFICFVLFCFVLFFYHVLFKTCSRSAADFTMYCLKHAANLHSLVNVQVILEIFRNQPFMLVWTITVFWASTIKHLKSKIATTQSITQSTITGGCKCYFCGVYTLNSAFQRFWYNVQHSVEVPILSVSNTSETQKEHS